MAAKSLMVEAARLKLLLPQARTADEIEAEMPPEEWMRLYGEPS